MRFRFASVLLALLTVAALGCKEEGSVVVRRLTFNGVKRVDESRLRNALATRASSRLPWGRKNYFDRSRFDDDLKRIQAFYSDRGFPDARVTGFDVNLNDKQDSVDITVTIAEGDPLLVKGIEFVGFDVIPEKHLRNLKNDVPLKIDQPRDRQLVVASHELALNELRDHGFPYAKVNTGENLSPTARETTVVFTAEPGTLAHFGEIQISGNQSVSNRVIERQVTFKPGDLFQRSLVQDTQRRLFAMELFQFVNVEPLNTAAQPPEVPTRITVAEGNHQRVNFGVGYGTDEKARVDTEYHHLNFLGGARSAGIHARWSSLDRGVRLDFNQPYFFSPHFSFGGEGQQWYTYTPAYRSVVSGAKATVTHKTNVHTSWAVSIQSEHDRSTIEPSVLNDPTLYFQLIAIGLDPTTGSQSGTLTAAGFDFQHTTADNLLNARRGYQLAFHFEQAGRVLPGTFNYTALTGDVRHYLPLGDRLVLASRLQAGNIAPIGGGQEQVPFSKRYFLGGATSIRGWGRYEVSPLAGGLPIGGDSMMAFTEEVRAIVRGNLGAVVFLDAGNVWEDSWGIRLNDLRYAVGPGLRYQTPVGPIRFDVGFQLNPVPGLLVNGVPETRHWRMHFSIGQAF